MQQIEPETIVDGDIYLVHDIEDNLLSWSIWKREGDRDRMLRDWRNNPGDPNDVYDAVWDARQRFEFYRVPDAEVEGLLMIARHVFSIAAWTRQCEKFVARQPDVNLSTGGSSNADQHD